MKTGAVGFFVLAAMLGGCDARQLQSLRRPTAEGLLAHWNCDSTDDSVLYDTSGNNHHGRITGGATTAPGRYGNALSLARGQYVTVPNFPNATRSFSVSAWSLIPSTDIGYGDIGFITNEVTSTGGWALNLDDKTEWQYYFRYFTGTDNGTDRYVSYGCPCLVTNRWVHLVAIVDGDAMTFSFYSDGAFRYSGPITQTIAPGMSDLMIGHWSTDKYYAGLIDDIAIYSRALTQDDIGRLRTAAVPDLVVPTQVSFPPDVVDAGETPDAAEAKD